MPPGPSAGSGPAAPGAVLADLPVPARHPRPATLWRTDMKVTRVTGDDTRVFVVRDADASIVALDVATGRTVWQAPLGAPTQAPGRLPNLTHGHGRLIYTEVGRVVAYGAADGTPVWQRRGDCRVQGLDARHALLRCLDATPEHRFQVIAHATGAVSAHFPGTTYDHGALGDDFVVIGDKAGTLRRHPLAGATQWSVATGAGADGVRGVVLADGVVLVVGETLRAFAAESGAALWQAPGAGAARAAFAEPVVRGGTVAFLTPGAVVARELRTGAARGSWPLPAALADFVRDHQIVLRAHGPRLVVAPLAGRGRGERMKPVLFAAQNAAGFAIRALPLQHPSALILTAGDRLVLAQSGTLAGYDLARQTPPLGDLPRDEALALIAAETDDPSERCRRFAELPQARALWAEILARPDDPRWRCAVDLVDATQPAVGARLRELWANLPDGDERGHVLAALGRNDEPATTALFVRLLAGEESSPPARPAAARSARQARAVAYDHLWRTGRTTEAGLCRAGPARVDPALRPGPPGSGVGTAHPLMLDAFAGDGAWFKICQARDDTDGDGRVAVRYGQHGDAFGDAYRPYLVLGEGGGVPIDELLAADDSGRYLALRERACLVVVDVQAGTRQTLANVDLRRRSLRGQHPTVRFDGARPRLVYRRGGATDLLVVRDLTNGREQTFEPGAGQLDDVRFAPDGRALAVDVTPGTAATDDARHGPIEGGYSCGADADAFYGYRDDGGRKGTTTRVLPLPEPVPAPRGIASDRRVEAATTDERRVHDALARRGDGKLLVRPGKPGFREVGAGPLVWR